MTLKADIYTYLSGLTSVTNQVSTRIYPGTAPTSATFPYVTYRRISATREPNFTSASGVVNATYQFDVFDDDSVGADTTAEILRDVWDGYDQGTIDTVNVRTVELVNERDEFLPPTDDTEVGIFNISQDYDIWYIETIPTFPAT